MVCGLNGVEGVPNSWRTSRAGPKALPWTGVGAVAWKRLVGRLHGVSGICALLAARPKWISSGFRLRLEIRPVDMKAAGSGLTSL